MPCICYVPKRFIPAHQSIIETANNIIAQYQAQGFSLTLRQLYYQFVARDLFPAEWQDPVTHSTNNVRSYKKLGTIISDGRRAGLVDWEAIEDRTRNLNSFNAWRSPEEIVQAVAEQYNVDLWAGQKVRVEAWVEKDALIGVLEVACRDRRIPYFSCRGYTSDSEVWGAAQRLLGYQRNGYKPIIFHLGDHDPSGIDMSRDIHDRLILLSGNRLSKLEVRRLALNLDQVEEYEPPPNPAKETDSRFAGYQEQYGDESWELDALEPTVISDLIESNVTELVDEARWAERIALRDEGRRILSSIAGNMQEVRDFLADHDNDSGEDQ